MRAAPFAYLRPDSLGEALEALSTHGDEAQLLAGGQSLLPAMALRMARPGILVDIGRLPALRGIAEEEGRLVVGACTTYAEALASPLVRRHAPLLALAIPHVAHDAVRTRGTLGGSLANADPASEMAACMIALDAEIAVASADGERFVPAADFVLGTYSTALEPGEILRAIRLPLAPAEGGARRIHAFREVARRSGDYAMAGGALVADLRDGLVAQARLVLFAVSDRPVLIEGAKVVLEGRAPGEVDLAALTAALDAEVEFFPDNQCSLAIRRHLAGMVARDLATRLGEEEDA